MGTSNKDGMEKAFNSLKLTDYLEEFLNDLGKRMIQSTDDHRESAFLFQRLSMCRAEADRAGEYMCEVNQLKEQLASRDRVVIEVNSELESVRQQMTKLNSDYQTTLHQLQLTQNARAQIENLKTENTELLNQRSRFQSEIEELNKRLRLEADRAGEYMCEVNQLKEQLASRDRVVIEINSELESFRQQITKLNNDHQTTLRQLQLTQNARAEIEQLRGELDLLVNQLNQRDSEIGELNIRLRAEADRAGEYMCEVNQLKEQLASRDRVVIEVNSELESVRQQMTKLNSDYQTTLHQLQLTQNALAEVEQLKAENAQQLLQLSQDKMDIAQLNKCVALAMDKTSGATDEVKMLRAELASRDSALAMVNTELNRLRRHTEQLNRKYQTALQKYDHQQDVKFECRQPCCVTNKAASATAEYAASSVTTATAAAAAASDAGGSSHVRHHRRILCNQPVGPVRSRSTPVEFSTGSASKRSANIITSESRLNFDQSSDDVVHVTSSPTQLTKPGLLQRTSVNHASRSVPASPPTCDVKIAEVSTDGTSIQLVNTSTTSDYDLGGHSIQQNIKGHPVIFYRFPSRLVVPQNAAVTVWAQEAPQPSAHQPVQQSIDVVYKGVDKWISDAHCSTVLCRPNGQAVSCFPPEEPAIKEAFVHPAQKASSPSQDSNRNEAVDTDSSGGSGRMVNGVQGGQQTTVDVGGRLQRGRASRAAFKISSTTDSCSAKCHSSQHLMQQQQNSNCCDSTTALVRTQQMPGLRTAGAPAQRLGSASLRRFQLPPSSLARRSTTNLP